MAYAKTVWTDDVTPVSAANMNKIEQGIADAHQATSDHDAETASGVHGSAAAATANKLAHRDANGDLFARVLQSTVPDGATAPLAVLSKALVTNLNADQVDGVHGVNLARIATGTVTVSGGPVFVTVGFTPRLVTASNKGPVNGGELAGIGFYDSYQYASGGWHAKGNPSSSSGTYPQAFTSTNTSYSPIRIANNGFYLGGEMASTSGVSSTVSWLAIG